jgi:tetratricopeptide (TPR) repeat protein
MVPFLAQVEPPGEGSEGSGSTAPPDFNQLYEQYNGNLIVTGLVSLLVLAALARIIQNVRSVSAYGVGLDRRIRRKIREYENHGQYPQAGDLLLQHGAFNDAAELYLKGEDWLRAGEAFEKAGQTPKAAQMYRRAGAPLMAADAFARRGQFALAAKEYLAAGIVEKAAECSLKANDFRAAAELFVKLERFDEAGEAYSRAGEKMRAAQCWKRYFDLQFDLVRGDLSRIQEARDLAVKASELMDDLGAGPEAAALLHKAGLMKRSAELYQRLGMIHEAAQVYIEAKKPMYASKLYESVGDHEKAMQYRAEARLLKNDHTGAAEDFAAAGEFIKAAEIYTAASQYEAAANMYEKASEFRTAADLYKLDGNLQAAASAYERSADYALAADLYNEVGDHNSEIRVAKSGNDWFRVGEVLLRYDRNEDALAAFQRVERLDNRFDAAAVLQADILRKLGRLDVALNKYREIVADQRPGTNNVEVFYKMAGTAMESGSLSEALQLYEKIIGVNYYYKDANKLAGELRLKVGAAGATAGGLQTPSVAAGAAGGSPRAGTLNSPADLGLARNSSQKRYLVEDEIARGGMGVVYRARDLVLDRIVAYKILSANLKENEVAVKYFLREARAAGQMSHQNIVTVFDAGEQDGEYYMAMEFVEGQTLKSLINRQGAFPEKLVRYIMVHVSKGLAYAHERGLVHRDVKPGNIMLTKDRTLKIMDFGLAKFVEEVNVNHTRAIGTPYYMSPEQISGKELDGRSDIYSLGVSIFECATGQVPFSKGDLPYHHLHTQPPDPCDVNPKISRELGDIILKCMEKEPARRFLNIQELLAVLKA